MLKHTCRYANGDVAATSNTTNEAPFAWGSNSLPCTCTSHETVAAAQTEEKRYALVICFILNELERYTRAP